MEKRIRKAVFNFISKLVCNRGVYNGYYHSLKILFLTISHETGWMIDRNVGHLTLEILGKKWYFTKEYEPIP